jgi:cytochrome P450
MIATTVQDSANQPLSGLFDVQSLPGPGVGAVWQAWEYWSSPERFFQRCAQLGDRFTLKMPGHGTWVCLTNPADIKRVFLADSSVLQFSEVLRRLTPDEVALGPVVHLEGPSHIRWRRMTLPSMQGQRLSVYEPSMVAATERMLQRWPWGESVSLTSSMQALALEVMLEIVFGLADVKRREQVRQHAMSISTELGSKRFLLALVLGIARGGRWTVGFSRLRSLVNAMDLPMREELQERRQQGQTDRADVLSMLLRATDNQEVGMSDDEILNTLRTLLLAGQEATALQLCWTAERMVRHADVLRRLDDTISVGDDSYLDAVIKESMRVRPAVPITARYVVQPLELDGLTVPAGMFVVPFIFHVHRRPDIYPEPLRFRPERFLERDADPYAWIPLGGGARRCLGGPFALFEMRVILRTILQHARFRLTTAPDEKIVHRQIGLAPQLGAVVTLDRRG